MKAGNLQGAASVALLLMGTLGSDTAALAQQAPPAAQAAPNNATTPAPPQAQQVTTTGQPGIPQAPEPAHPGPLYLRETAKDYSNLKSYSFKHPFGPYTPTDYNAPRLSNTPRLGDLLRDGRIYLSLSDAVLLTLENNFDIEIARVNLDIADTDILRAKAGSTLRGVSTGLITNTLGGTSSTVTGGGGPGGTGAGSGGTGAGASGLVLTTNGGGPTPLNRDGLLTGTLQYEDNTQPGGAGLGGGSSTTTTTTTGTGTGTGTTGTGTGTGTTTTTGTGTTGTSNLFNANPTETNTGTYNFGYTQGFSPGMQLSVSFSNSRTSSNSTTTSYRPSFSSGFRATLTQQFLQGFGPGIQNRFIVQAKNNRRIADSAFRTQLISTITQVESIYWSLVSAYEDVQAKTRALEQSTQLASDNRRQLEIGTLAPLDIVNSDQAVVTDRQSLTTSQSNLEYQQLLMKQAIVRDLNDPQLATAPVIPTDRISLDRIPEEDMSVEDLVKEAYTNNPSIEQAALNMENNKITIKAEKNGLLPILNGYAFYGGTGIAGTPNPTSTICTGSGAGVADCGLTNVGGYGHAFTGGFNNSAPDYGVGASLQVPIRNRPAQADQARSQMEYRQAQMRLQQLYTQIRIQVINGQFALTNDRATVVAAQYARDYQAQALDAEQKRFRLGSSTTANVLQQERNLATAEDTLITDTAVYARDRASLLQILANTLDRYGVNLEQAASGVITTQPVVPGLTAPQPPAPPKPLTSNPPPIPADLTRPANSIQPLGTGPANNPSGPGATGPATPGLATPAPTPAPAPAR